MFDNILVPTDGSTCAEMATEYATDLASRYGATVHVLCVADSRTLENAPQYQRIKAERTELAEQASTDISTAGIQVEQTVQTDVPYRAILEYAADQEIDLIVMGTHGRTGVERYLLGSVTEKVVRRSDVPVLTVSVTDEGAVAYPYGDVLVPTDGSDGAAAALDPAVDIASTYDARLHALSVVDPMAMGIDARPDRIAEQLEDAARTAVETVEERARDASISAIKTAVESGPPYRAIRSYADANDIDLIVMGTHGRSGIERYLLGSVAEKTVRTSSVPVMTVRRP
ncbi:universal stress protein [Halogeometricum borinquense]|uniref:Universal stress protein n=1 Tax=Halogeometricum borinquense TaxID=60847 RepID=A0A482SY32_9EURY|nr:universal stress protein [Halogeometricum borinquense]RYJ08414.1 universal stress protein [Halogeometricum borinquense]